MVRGDERVKGRVTWWNNSNNCGFIEIDDEEVFVHSMDNFNIHDNQLLEFSIIQKNGGLFIYDLKQI